MLKFFSMVGPGDDDDGGSDPDNSGDNEPPDHDPYDEESSP